MLTENSSSTERCASVPFAHTISATSTPVRTASPLSWTNWRRSCIRREIAGFCSVEKVSNGFEKREESVYKR